MQTETKNPRPGGTSNLPTITLLVLVGLVAALLYVGYDYFVDNTNGTDQLTNVALDTTSQQPVAQNDPDMLIAPDETDNSALPTPVDLTQATPLADAPEANALAEDVAAANRETTDGKPDPNEKPVAEAKPVAEKPKAEKPIDKPKPEPVAEKPSVKPATVEPVAVNSVAVNSGGVANTHTVKAGETFYGVANKYNMSINTLKKLNPDVSEKDIKAGVTKLNVKVRAVHTVGAGDVLRVVAEKYGVSKEALMRANGKTKDMATRGEKLVIPYSEKQ